MTYGRGAQPDIIAHMGHIETWLRYYDTHAKKSMYLVNTAWERTAKRIKQVQTKGTDACSQMQSAMSACIASLIAIGIDPKTPTTWETAPPAIISK